MVSELLGIILIGSNLGLIGPEGFGLAMIANLGRIFC